MIPGNGHVPSPPRKPAEPGETLRLAMQVLLREAALGCLLWGGAAADGATWLVWFLLNLCAILLWTRHLGLLRPRSWAMAFGEGGLLYVGALCFCSLLLALFGAAPWWR